MVLLKLLSGLGWVALAGCQPSFLEDSDLVSILIPRRSLEITRNMSGEALRSPGLSALVHFLFHQPSLLPFKHLTLGLSFKLASFMK